MPSTSPVVTPGAMAESVGFARVIADHASAVLLVDLSTRRVVYVNELGRQLAPHTSLPVDVDEWARAAGLQTTQGTELGSTTTPLHRVAEGFSVRGEVVTARRQSDVTEARERLWIIGVPLTDAPEPLGRQALVVVLPLRDEAGVAQARAAGGELRDRAVISSELAFSISDPTQDGNPLIWVNPAFEVVTGYTAAEVVGRNCRFLQGPLTDRDAVARIRTGLATTGSVNETLLNYRADGTVFWNQVVISPVYDADGALTHHVAIQTDVTERVRADEARETALATAHAANERLSTLAGISDALSARLGDTRDLLSDLPEILADHLNGWVVAVGLDGTNAGVAGVARGRDTDTGTDTDAAVREALTAWFDGPGREAVLDAQAPDGSDRPRVWTLDTGSTDSAPVSLAVTSMPGRGEVVGLLGLARAAPFADPAELTALADLGRRAGLALDNARLYAREHDIAIALQRSLLPRLPVLPSFDIAADYLASTAAADVGGDWYDVLDLPGPWVGVAVGDVMGHDMRAAATMGQLRAMVRTLAWSGARPSELVTRLDELVRAFDPSQLATLLYAFLDDPAAYDGVCTVHYTSAGHPPAVLKHPDGHAELLDGAITAPIGVPDRPFAVPQSSVVLPLGGTLVMYTDGLIERRHLDIGESIDTLVDLVAGLPADLSADAMRRRIAGALVDPVHADDTCLLVVRRRV